MWARALPVLLIAFTTALGALDSSREQVIKIVTEIKRADYEGDRAALKRLHGELTPFADNKELAARVRYWRGFALWRRAINGFNDSVAAAELQDDLQQARGEFGEASRKDPSFVDPKIGTMSCAGLLAYSISTSQKDPARIQELMIEARQLRKEVEALAPENPRLVWVMGPVLWNIPPERGGGQTKAIESYEKSLDGIRQHKAVESDPLEPSWGEPELLMNLAWSNLNRATPDVDASEKYARSALALVPYWHYVRDILMKQIQDAKAKHK